MIGRQVSLKCPNFKKCHLHLYGGLIPWDVNSPCQKWKKVKVLNLVVGGWRCIICCRRELAETVAALQQRRLLTEAKEYTLSIKVLGQLGPQPLSSRCFLAIFGFWKKPIPSSPTKKGGVLTRFLGSFFWMLLCLHRRSGKKYILKSANGFSLQNHQHPSKCAVRRSWNPKRTIWRKTFCFPLLSQRSPVLWLKMVELLR